MGNTYGFRSALLTWRFGKMATLYEDTYLGSFPNLYSAVYARGTDGIEGPRLHHGELKWVSLWIWIAACAE